MPRGLSIPSLGNVPEITILARIAGDFSSLAGSGKGIGPRRRLINRGVGRAAGKVFGFANANFGVFGLIATAQFFAILKDVINLQTAQSAGDLYIGSVCNYATEYHNGTSNMQARPFLKMALNGTPVRAPGGGFRVPTSLRGGLYQGQKFISDFAAFFRGDLIGRLSRREAGRNIASFFWGSLRLGAETKRPNILEGYANRVVAQSRRNIRTMGEDTGTLRMSIATGFDRAEVSRKSFFQASNWLASKGKSSLSDVKLFNGILPENSLSDIGVTMVL